MQKSKVLHNFKIDFKFLARAEKDDLVWLQYLLYFVGLFYNKKRKDAKIKINILHSEKIRWWRGKNHLPFSKVRFISDVYDSPATTFIYGNKVAIIMWTNPLFGIVINSLELAKSYLNFFTLLWEIAKP